MKSRVIITVNVRKPELLETATLTLRSVRVGFPTSEIIVVNTGDNEPRVYERAMAVGARYFELPGEHYRVFQKFTTDMHRYSHKHTIFLDSDLIFYENCEGWTFDRALAGYRVPAHRSHYTDCGTVARLHTSFLVVQVDCLGVELKEAGVESRAYAPVSLWRPQMVYQRGQPLFFDTAAHVYQAIGGNVFTPAQLDSYTHIFCGSARDIAKQHLPAATYSALEAAHIAALVNPQALRGLWRQLTWA